MPRDMFKGIHIIWKSVLAILALVILCQQVSFAQTTRIKGRVTDAQTGEGIPFAGIAFKDTFIGVSSDMDGYFTLETRDEKARVLSAVLLGYETQEVEVKVGAYNEITFVMKPIFSELASSTIKADDRKVRRLMQRVQQNKPRNNPMMRPGYECDTYTKLEMDLIDADVFLDFRTINRNFGFIFDYMDTSVVGGKKYLPAMITETIAHSFHQKSPAVDREEIIATRISGIDNTPTIAQFTGTMHIKTNLYENFLDMFDVQIPSPLSSSGFSYYNYFLIDSLDIAGRKTYKVRFHPISTYVSAVFDGEMNIDAEDYALQEAHIKLMRGNKANWIRDMVIDIESQRTDSGWFNKYEKVFAEFSPENKEVADVPTFFGTRQTEYSNPIFYNATTESVSLKNTNVSIRKDAVRNDEEFWQKARPYPLTSKEQGIYHMVDSVKAVPQFKGLYNLGKVMTNGFYDFGRIAYGPYYKSFSFNPLEGARFLLGGRTTFEYSRTKRYTGYVAYGTKDKQLKGSATAEFMFGTEPTRKLTLSAKHDVVQLGKSEDAFADGNIMSSIMSKGNSEKLSPITEVSVTYDHEWSPGFNNTLSLEMKRIRSNSFVPMVKPDGEAVRGVGLNQLRYTARLSWDETATRGHFEKTYLYSKYPIISFGLAGSVKGLSENDFTFLRPELQIDYRLVLPPIGTSRIQLSMGKIFGQVPYPLLKLFEGNGAYFLDEGAFACMDYYEFAADQWATIFYNHNFKGYFFGKIPLLRRLNWRENFIAKAAYGTISDKNNGSLGSTTSCKAPLLFPEGLSSLDKPYIELGVGVSNIFKLFRVDAYRRMTHRDEDRKKNFAVNFGIEFAF